MHAYTILTRSPTTLVARLNQLSNHHKDQILLFTLSSNVPSQHLPTLVQSLTSLSKTSLGCLTAPLPGPPRIACSLAFFHSSNATPFFSTIPGRATPQVGRAFRNSDTAASEYYGISGGDINWTEVWERRTNVTDLPPQLEHLRNESVTEVLYLTDRAPEGLVNSLLAFPDATQLGLIAASTPFITGRPVTLFYNDQVHDSGAVGIVRRNLPQLRVQTEFSDVVAISPALTITGCEGNMVNTINNINPTQLLLQIIQKSGMAVGPSGSFRDNEALLLGTIRDGKVKQMYRITAGDPSRGNLSLASQRAPDEGTEVQFFHQPKLAKLELSRSESIKGVKFITCLEESLELPEEDIKDVETLELRGKFIAASENGFVLGERNEAAWTCTVPGGAALLE